MPPRKQPHTAPPFSTERRDGHFPTHSVQVADPGKPFTVWFTTVGHFMSDAEAVAGAIADYPMKEVRVIRHDGFIVYDSKERGARR